MQDSGRDSKGKFVKGVSGNPKGRPRLDAAPQTDVVRTDTFDTQATLNVVRVDGWQNATTGVGVPGFDKRLNTTFVSEIVSYQQAVELWRGDDIAARVVETLPREALKKGWELVITDEGDFEDLKEQVETLVDDLAINEAFETALRMERAYGGSALLIGANDGQDMSMPLDPARIMELQWVTPLEPIEITPLKAYDDPGAPKYGKPELYLLNTVARHGTGSMDPLARALPTATTIHESRLIIFPGYRVSKFQTKNPIGGAHWGDPVFNRFIRVLADFNLGYASTGIILSEQGLPIFGMKELAKLVNANRLDIIRARLGLLFQQMSTARAAVIDTEESYERKAMPLTQLPETLDRLAARLAAAVEMPLTKLLGQSPKGLGNEGESDMKFWYDNVEVYQNQKIRRPLRELVRIVIAATRQPEPQKWSLKFPPLMQMSAMEMAQARGAQATTDVAYIQAGVVSPDDIRKSRFSGEYSFETQVDFEAYAMMEGAMNQPLTPEDMMAMGLDPNNPEDVARAQEMQAQQAMQDPNAQIDPETGEPLDPNAQPEIDPETGEPVAPPEGVPEGEAPPEGPPGAKPSPFGKKPAPGAKPGVPGEEPPPGPEGAKKPPFGKKSAPGAKPGEAPPEGEEPVGPEGAKKPAPFGKKAPLAKPGVPGEEPPPEDGEVPPEGAEGEDGEAPPEGTEGEPDLNNMSPEEAEALLAQVSEMPVDGEPNDGRRLSGETDTDRQRQASTAPGITHLADRDKDGKVTSQERQQTIDDIMQAIAQLKAKLGKDVAAPSPQMVAKKPGAPVPGAKPAPAAPGKPAPFGKKPSAAPGEPEKPEGEEPEDDKKKPPFRR